MKNEEYQGDNSTLEEFHQLLDLHEREVELGNASFENRKQYPTAPPRRWLRPLILFLVTCLSTYFIGGITRR